MTTTAVRYPNLRFVVTLLLVAIGVLCFATVARAQPFTPEEEKVIGEAIKAALVPAEPKFGGCLAAHPDTCFAPAVSVNVVAMSVHDGKLTSTFDPGIGYGASVYSSRWYRAGLSGTLSFPTFSGERRAQPALMFSFAEYVRIGVACPLYVAGGFPRNGMVLLGFGSDFGRW